MGEATTKRGWAGLAAVAVAAVALAGVLIWQPLSRDAPPALKPGGYRMTWRGQPYETSFRADGYFVRFREGQWWRGTWRQEGGTLHVQEWPSPSPDKATRWSVALESPRRGVLDDGSPWSLAVAGREDSGE
jgi:hypothetical protein